MLTQQQLREAALPNVLGLFGVTGMSESERLETGLMLQRMVIEGYLRGVNVPGILRRKEQVLGRLHFGFNDSGIPTRNMIQFDRNQWRSQPIGARMTQFLNKVGTRLSSDRSAPPPPSTNAAPRYSPEPPRSGPVLRTPSAVRGMHEVAQRIVKAVSPGTFSSVFKGLESVQRNMGVAPPIAIAAPRQNELMAEGIRNARDGFGEVAQYQTRQEMMTSGVDPMRLSMMPARSGIASPKPMGSQGVSDGLAASGRPQRALLYAGQGVWGTEVQETKENLEALGIQYDVVTNLSGVDYAKYGAVIWPGGNAGTQNAGVSATEETRLKQAIQGGLNYLGHCAGAFIVGTYSSGFGMLPGVPGVRGTDQIVRQETMWDGTKRDVTFYGGPTDLSVYGGRSLAKFDDGGSSIQSTNYGQGHMILTAGHPGVETAGDRDGADDDLHQMLIKAVLGGVDPDGAIPPGGTPPGTNTTNNNITSNVMPTSINPTSGAQGLKGTGRKPTVAPHRKTAVAGMLPKGMVNNTFGADLQSAIQQAGPMLGQLAGALQGLK